MRAQLSPNPGYVVTVCIAAIVEGPGLIVTVSDRMLSSPIDLITATDNATLKARTISDDWAVMFSGDGALFFPFVAEAQEKLRGAQLTLVQRKRALQDIYKSMREDSFFDSNIAKLGYRTLDEFRANGLKELGHDTFNDFINDLRQFDFGIQFIVYGHDKDGSPHIYSLGNPGVLVNHNLERYAVIGSGTYMAMAALSRKPLPRAAPNAVIYRVLGAKFSAETAAGVGKSTTVMIFNSRLRVSNVSTDVIERVRSIWDKELNAPDPDEALNAIDNSGAVQQVNG